jgi:hypothetical protein
MQKLGGGVCLCLALVGALWLWLEAHSPRPVEAAELPGPSIDSSSVRQAQPPAAVVLEWEGAPARVPSPVLAVSVPVPVSLPADAPAPVTESQLLRWIEDLRDDEVNWNATRAAYELWSHLEQAKPLLLAALRSPDAQQRGLAGYILSDLPLTDPAEQRALAGVLAESLEHPQHFPREVRSAAGELVHTYTLSFSLEQNAYAAFQLHGEYRALALPTIERIWRRADDERGREAGYLLAFERGGRMRYEVAQRAVEHLVDNQIGGDAVISLRTLTRLGSEALPVVLDALPGPDPQSEQLLGHWLSYFAPEHRQSRRLSGRQLGGLGFWYGDWVLAEREHCGLGSSPPAPELELATMEEEFPPEEPSEY